MSERLIARISAICAALLLSACCIEGTESDCTASDIARIKQESQPVFVSEQNGVGVWRVYDRKRQQTVWFTTPCGDVSWTTREGGKVKHDVPHQVNGQGCKP